MLTWETIHGNEVMIIIIIPAVWLKGIIISLFVNISTFEFFLIKDAYAKFVKNWPSGSWHGYFKEFSQSYLYMYISLGQWRGPSVKQHWIIISQWCFEPDLVLVELTQRLFKSRRLEFVSEFYLCHYNFSLRKSLDVANPNPLNPKRLRSSLNVFGIFGQEKYRY